MINLVKANIKRLIKNRVFKISVAIVAALGLFQIITLYLDYNSGLGIVLFKRKDINLGCYS